jgi:hypothetical protein
MRRLMRRPCIATPATSQSSPPRPCHWRLLTAEFLGLRQRWQGRWPRRYKAEQVRTRRLVLRSRDEPASYSAATLRAKRANEQRVAGRLCSLCSHGFFTNLLCEQTSKGSRWARVE